MANNRYNLQKELDDLELLNDNMVDDEMNAMTTDEVRGKYFTNPEMPEEDGDLSLIGQMVGQKYNEPQRDIASETLTDPYTGVPRKIAGNQGALTDEETQSPLHSREQLLNQFNELKQLQNQVSDRNKTLNMTLGGNQIAQAIARGYGANIGDGSEVIGQLRKDNEKQITDYQDRIKNKMDDPNSDISKTYRLFVARNIKEKYPDLDISELDNMSANELEKLAKAQATAQNKASIRTPQQTDYETINGQPLSFNPIEGSYYNILTGEKYTGQVRRKITSNFTDPTSGNVYKTDSLGNIIKQIQATNPLNNIQDLTGGTSTPVQQDPKVLEALKTPTSLKQANPNLYKEFKKDQDAFVKDTKDNREVATSAMALASKLKPGRDNQIDSGLLGGIQTQAARMAGQKGVLTDKDLEKFAGAGGVAATISRIVDGTFFGDMSDRDIEFFRMFSRKMQEANASDVQNRAEIFSKNIYNEAKDYLPGLTEDIVKKNWLNVDSIAPASQTPTPDQTGTVRRRTADGRVALFDAKTKKFIRYEDK